MLYKDGVEQSMLRTHMGSIDWQTVFKAEVLGMVLAAELRRTERDTCSATIGDDSHAAILMTRHNKGTPGQYLVDLFHEQMAAIEWKHAGIELELRWTPGHSGVIGNKRADEEAKKATLSCPCSSGNTSWSAGQLCAKATRRHSRPRHWHSLRKISQMSPDMQDRPLHAIC